MKTKVVGNLHYLVRPLRSARLLFVSMCHTKGAKMVNWNHLHGKSGTFIPLLDPVQRFKSFSAPSGWCRTYIVQRWMFEVETCRANRKMSEVVGERRPVPFRLFNTNSSREYIQYAHSMLVTYVCMVLIIDLVYWYILMYIVIVHVSSASRSVSQLHCFLTCSLTKNDKHMSELKWWQPESQHGRFCDPYHTSERSIRPSALHAASAERAAGRSWDCQIGIKLIQLVVASFSGDAKLSVKFSLSGPSFYIGFSQSKFI